MAVSDVKVPAYMRAAARRGLQYVSEGKAGDGLKQQTINEARKMAAGEISDDKWIRMAAWIARHLGDLDSPEADPQHPNYPSAGVVAHLLWGSGPSKTKARAAMEFAQGVVERIRKEEDRHLPGKHAQKTHGGGRGGGGTNLDDMPFELNPNGQNASSIIEVSQSKVNEFYETATDAEKQLFEDNLRRSFTIAAEDEMVIQYPSDRLKNLAKDQRLKTIHEGAKPKFTDDRYEKYRKEQELTSYGVPVTAKPSEYPIYGHFPGKNFSQYQPVAMYGNTQLVLNENVAGRATMTLGDSLGFAIPVKITSVRDGSATTADLINAATPKVLDIQIDQARRGNILNHAVNAGYTEVQIYGGVKLSDLSSIRISPSAWNDINNTSLKTAQTLRETGLIELKSDWIR